MKIIFPESSDRAMYEMTQKGWVEVRVELPNRTVVLHFTDLTRAEQDLASQIAMGIPCLGESNLVIVQEVTKDIIEESVDYLSKSGYFEN